MSRTASVLTMKEQKTKAYSFKMTETLFKKLEDLDKRLATEAPGAELDRAVICTTALENAVEQANAELDKRKQATA